MGLDLEMETKLDAYEEDFSVALFVAPALLSESAWSRTFNPASMRRHSIGSTHWLRHAGASKGSAKYCVSCTTLPLRNSIMLTVYAGLPW